MRVIHKSYVLRDFESFQDLAACVRLQKKTWGEDFGDCVPPSILMVGAKIGGVSAGAFDASGNLVGFVFGLSGIRNGRLVHWSDMLAVKPDLRDAGLGMALKLFQREKCLQSGAETVYWTFDPLEARNAHLNINKLGAEIDEYVEDMYGESASTLHQGLPTDRLIVAWQIGSERVAQALAGERPRLRKGDRTAPIINPVAAAEPAPAAGSVVRIEIPDNIQTIKKQAMEQAQAWRLSVRAAFQSCLQRGYTVDGFYRDESGATGSYVLRRP